MIEVFSIEFWMAILFFINFFLFIFLFVFVKKINGLNIGELRHPNDDGQAGARKASRSAVEIIKLLEPLVQDARNTAISFDQQIKEKKRLLKELNMALDSRIVSLNLVLSRITTLQKQCEEKPGRSLVSVASNEVFDQQNQIIEMYHQQVDMDIIAHKLSIPKGEVQLVIDLKKKFMAMEENSR